MFCSDPEYEKANDTIEISIVGPDEIITVKTFNSSQIDRTLFKWQWFSFNFTATEDQAKVSTVNPRK
jgi:hypothetical protein